MEEEDPLLPSTETTLSSASSSSSSILGRLAFLLFLASAALFANYEASKSFEIVVASSSPFDHSPAARRYRLSFVSNGRATSIVLDAARHINKLLQLGGHPNKPIRRVTIQLAAHNLTRTVVAVTPGTTGPNDYIVSLSPTLFLQIHKDDDADATGERVEAALRRGMARVSIWDGEGTAPTKLLDALTEVLSGDSDIINAVPVGRREPEEDDQEGPCWAEPGFLKYYEERRSGFLGRLNKGMKEKWRPGVVAEAIGHAVAEEEENIICGAYYSSISATATATGTGFDQIM